jgi:hypothetical protein
MTATTRTFQDMLNEYLPNELLREELVKRDYVLSTVEKDDGWKTGTLIVPFKAAGASSVAYGSLTASDDVAEDAYVRGEVSSAKEIWGTMLFNHRDIMEHDQVSEQNFLKLLPDTIEDFVDYVKNVLSVNLLNGAHFASLTADYTGTDGLITVDHPDRFVIGQKVIFEDTPSTGPFTAYVKAVNINTGVVALVTTRGGSTTDITGGLDMTVANASKLYHPGATANAFSSLRGALLAATHGGDSALYGETKTDYTFLQAVNISGAGITQANILEQIFLAFVEIRRLGKGNPNECLMSWTNLGYCMAAIENSKGSFNVVPGSSKASQYGWMEIQIGSVTKGMLKLVGIQEADDDIIMFIDWRAVKFYSNGFFQKRKGPNGNEYFEVRATTGYQYLVDICCFGELVVQRPSYCGILYSVSITKPLSAG